MHLQQLPIKRAVIGASETDVSLGDFALSTYSSKNLRVDIDVSGVAGTVTVRLQNRSAKGPYQDLSSANSSVVLANGTNSIRLNLETAADVVDMPLRKTTRLLITTGAGATVTLEGISVQQG